MESREGRVIVGNGLTPGCKRVHHQDFPEIRTDGESEQEAARHLVHQLRRALDSALTNWRRQSIEAAIADVEAFLKLGA
jgi:hypothetical protein